MSTSIIMPVHIMNDELLHLTIEAINSIGKTESTYKTELIIVDNNSSLGADLIQQVSQKYLRHSRNRGYPKAVNQGVMLSEGQFLAIANNDIRVSPNWLTVAKEIFFAEPLVGSVHYRMINYYDEMKLGINTYIFPSHVILEFMAYSCQTCC